MGRPRRKATDTPGIPADTWQLAPAPRPSPSTVPQPTGLYFRRGLVYGTLLMLGSLMLLDAIPQYTLMHGKLRDVTDPILDVTGLWQGSWELFAPSPDQLNKRIGATLTWQDAEDTLWLQPDWQSMTPLGRSRYFRQMSYYDNLGNSSHQAAWRAMCEHLAKEQTADSSHTLTSITLFEERDVIAPPDKSWRPAYAAPQFNDGRTLIHWVPHAQ